MTTDQSTALTVAEELLTALVPSILRGVRSADRDDIRQNVRVKLIETIIPSYQGRGPLRNYLSKAIRNALRDERDRLRNVRTHAQLPADDLLPTINPVFGDIELVGDVQAQPDNYLSKGLARLLTAILETPNYRAAAQKLGIKPESVHRMNVRLRHELRALFDSQSRFVLPARQ